MIKVEALEPFTLERFKEINIIERKGANTYGLVNKGDIFECNEEMANYLTKGNSYQKQFIRIIEVIPKKKTTKAKKK